jgi:metal-dependent amidase/aminoacylase/carboxypeptidase family protein
MIAAMTVSPACESPADPLQIPPGDWVDLGLEETLAGLLPELIQLRRHFHRHPELSGHEQQTAALVAGELRRWGWQVSEAVGRTGVVGELGPAGGPLVALRVDMDALPIEERTGLPWLAVGPDGALRSSPGRG